MTMEQTLAIKGITSVKVLHDFQDSFLRLTGIDFSIIDFKNQPIISPRYASRFCKALLSSKKDSQFLDTVKKASGHVTTTKKPYVYNYQGLIQSMIPIVVNGEAIGAILTCPIRISDSPKHLPDGVAKDRHSEAQLQNLYRDLPTLAKEQIKGLSELLSTLINYIFKNEFDFLVTLDSDKQYSRNQEAVIKAARYIKNNYHDKDLSLKKVAAEVALSHYYFSHIFKDELKITFIEYLTKIRMEAAAKLLKNRNLSVNQIAYAVGYQDPNYFSKVFKRVIKIPPLDYRSNLLKKGVEKQIITI